MKLSGNNMMEKLPPQSYTMADMRDKINELIEAMNDLLPTGPYKKGDVIIHKSGYHRKVLGACGDVVFIEGWGSMNPETRQYNRLDNNYTIKGQEVKDGWPQEGDIYYSISSCGGVIKDTYNEGYDEEYLSFGNMFRTREEAQAKLEEIKKILKK